MRIILILLLLVVGITAVRAFGVGGAGDDVGHIGVETPGVPPGGGGGGGGGCSNSLIFNVACNSQYIATGPLR